MAAQPTEEVIEWHKRLSGESFDYWIPTSVTACFTEEKLKALSDIYSSGNFSNLTECLKTKLLLALCNMPQRNSDQWRPHIDAIFNVALSEGSESWVRPIADMLYTLPSLGYLRTGLEDNPLVADALTTVQTKRLWRLSSLPMEAEFVNPDVLVDLGCPEAQQQQQQRHFVIVRKPRSVVAMGVILEKAAKQRDDGQEGGRRYTAPIKMRSFAKNWYDEDDNDTSVNESSSSSTSGRRPQPSSLSSGGHRLPMSQMRQRTSQPAPPLHLLARQRSINPPSTPGGPIGLHHHQTHPQSQQQQQQQQRTTKLIELSEPPAIGRAAKARRRQEETERRRQEERAAKEEAAARAAQAREADEARKQAVAKETEEAAAAEAAAASAAAAATAAAAAAASAPPSSSVINVGRGSAQANVSMATHTAYNSGASMSGPLPQLLSPMAAATQSPSVVPATLPSLRLTPANSQQQPQQQQQQAPAAAPTPSYLLPFASAYAGQMQQPTLFAYSQPTASATPNNITVVQLVNRPYPVQQQLPNQQQQQQQPLQHQHQLQHQPLTPEQTRAAAELFATANKLTKPEKSLIVAFIGGNRTNLTPELGHLVRIHLSEYKERVFDQNQRVYKDVVADQYFQMDYSTGDWTIVKRYKEGAPEILARLEYLRPQQQQQQQ